ncbi:hypothetical protein ACVIN2_002186 [Bradyrhizobium sp. USDA 3650]
MKSSEFISLPRRVGVVIRHHLAFVEIRRERIETGQREAVAETLDLVRQAPPFLDDDHARRVAARGIGEIPRCVLAVRALEGDGGSHGVLRRVFEFAAFWRLSAR